MRSAIVAALSAMLTGCISAAPVQVPTNHPASPRASSGLVDMPSALTGYRSAEQFETPPAEETSMGSMHHDGMPGMDHGSMPGMQHGGAPSGASRR